MAYLVQGGQAPNISTFTPLMQIWTFTGCAQPLTTANQETRSVHNTISNSVENKLELLRSYQSKQSVYFKVFFT